MNTVNYNDAEQLFGAVGTSLKKHTAEIADIVNVYGAKNLLPLTVDGIKSANSSASWSGNSCTINGVTFTILTDNDGNVTGIKANGTATSNAELFLANFNAKVDVTYTLNGGLSTDRGLTQRIWTSSTKAFPAGHRLTSYDASVYEKTTQTALADEECVVSIWINKQITLSNQTFYPMIRLASIEDDTYEPYAKTNKELTDDISSLAARIKAIEDTNHLTWG